MNNFRGFHQTLIPLKTVNFLLGENSTGKTSFLKLLAMVLNYRFWQRPGFFWQHPDPSLGELFGSFNEVISKHTDGKNEFQIGLVSSSDEKGEIESLYLYSFIEDNGMPVPNKFLATKDKKTLNLTINPDVISIKYKEQQEEQIINSLNGSDIHTFFEQSFKDTKGYENFKDIPLAQAGFDLSIILFYTHQTKNKNKDLIKFFSDLLFPFIAIQEKEISLFAPVRAVPKRFYGGSQQLFSPEGEHTPFVLKKLTENKNEHVAKALKKFGETSGLFKSIKTHSFGKETLAKGELAPFEIEVELSGDIKTSINNVGYGVSQILPLIIDFFASSKKSKIFLTQQPEVHLHPKAQAALGEIIFELAEKEDQTFFIETHSDYLVDRYRLSVNRSQEKATPSAQVLFFERTPEGNIVYPLPLSSKGAYPEEQPKSFREFFVNEAIDMLGV
jgi:hypothetical protein